jgi:hypothetical protein
VRPFLLALLALAAILAAEPRSQTDTKALADGLVHELRALQNEDGTYGSGIEDTCKVLDLLSRSPRRYNELDGPFFRKAADAVLAADKLEELDGWRAVALAGCVGDAYARERDVLVGRLLKRAERDWGTMSWPELFALNRITPDEAPRPPQHIVNFGSPALRVLCGADATRIPPPRLRDTKRWVRWATAARLRGVEIGRWPDAPAAGTERDLAARLQDLEHTIAVHGLKAPGDAAEDGAGDGDEVPPVVDEPLDRETALRTSLQWLRAHQENGTFGLEVPGWEGPEPGVTALLLAATQWTCAELGEPVPGWVDEGLDWLTTLQDADGAIAMYGVRTYTTSVAMEALLDRGRDADVVARALEFLRTVQADEGEGYDADVDPHYGGVGYGGDERPDLSNTHMAVEAARRAGLDVDDEFFQKAMVFLERNHNLGEARVDSWPRAGGGEVISGTDGGATYMCLRGTQLRLDDLRPDQVLHALRPTRGQPPGAGRRALAGRPLHPRNEPGLQRPHPRRRWPVLLLHGHGPHPQPTSRLSPRDIRRRADRLARRAGRASAGQSARGWHLDQPRVGALVRGLPGPLHRLRPVDPQGRRRLIRRGTMGCAHRLIWPV